MKRFEARTLFGGGLVLLGSLMLLERFGILRGAADLFWGVALLLAASYFLYVFAQDPQERWWAIIPALSLLGMAANVLLPKAFSGLGGGIFLGALGLAFFIIYLTDRSRWWAIIPGGVLFTLALVASLEEVVSQVNTASLFFVGLGFTFLLVAILPNPGGKMQWAYIPAAVLMLMGALLGSQSNSSLADYIWPAALIIAGLVVILSFIIQKE